ncbi:MAG: hypothetical protein GXY32_02270 [Ruminococcaceae bacterium]|nr:hypothetical protein [Oscillospiraceae bacterium]
MYNEAMQNYNQDLMLWNQLMGLNIDLVFAEEKNETEEVERLEYKIDQIMSNSVSEDFGAAIVWAA